MNSASFAKLRDGSWGIRSLSPLAVGESVLVSKKDGSSRTVVVAKIVWAGNGTTLATFDDAAPAKKAPRRKAAHKFSPAFKEAEAAKAKEERKYLSTDEKDALDARPYPALNADDRFENALILEGRAFARTMVDMDAEMFAEADSTPF